jgi:hypothetical protein
MTGSPVAAPATRDGTPEVRLLDATQLGLDDAGLRSFARAATRRTGAPHSSRSYRYPYALITWHDAPVGVDLERIEACDEAFADLICTPAERADPACSADRDNYLSSLWCAKEALAKALGDARRYDPARLESPARWPGRRAGPWRTAPLAVTPGHVGWICWRALDRHPGVIG